MKKAQQLPAGWVKGKFSDLAHIEMGQSPVGSSYNQTGEGIPLINGPTEFSEVYPIKKQWTNRPTKLSQPGDILICVRGSSTGRLNISNEKYCIGRGVAAIRAKKNSNTSFVHANLQYVTQQILSLSSGSTFPSIDKKSLNAISILIPPSGEQEVIAAVLDAWDEAIQTQNKLITALRKRQQTLQYQLLTGETRLILSGEWKLKRLRELFNTLPTANNSRADLLSSGEIAYIHYGDIHTKYHVFLDGKKASLPFVESKKLDSRVTHLKNGDLVVVDASEDYKGIGKCVEMRNIEGLDAVAGLHTILLRSYSDLSIEGFRGYMLLQPQARQHIESMATGVSVYGISKSNLLNTPVYLPPIPEQQAITAVLNTAAEEIRLREAELKALRKQKRGLMQQLLTGQLRVSAVAAR